MSVRNVIRRFVTSAAVAAISTVAFAQVAPAPTPFSLEGKINAFGANAAGNTITVVGTQVQVPAGLPNHTPTTKKLTWAELTDPTRPSMVGVATAIVAGTVDATGPNVATTLFVEIAENVIVNPVT